MRADRLHGLEHRLGLDDHAWAPTKGHVVDLPVPIVREVAEVVCMKLDYAALDATTDHPMLEHGAEHGWEDRDDVKSHAIAYRASSTSTSQSATTTRRASRFTSMTASRVAGMRCSTVPSRLTQTSLAGRAQRLTRTRKHRQSHHLVVVVATLAECAAGVVRNLEVPATEKLSHGAVVDPTELYDETRLARPAPFDLALATIEEHGGSCAEPVIEVCQGNDLDSTFGAVGAGYLADADQDGAPPL